MDERISAAFEELGIVVPPAYNGACLRCAKRWDKYDDLCGDCEDLCEGGADGFEATIRSELGRAGWYISCLGENAPPPDCTSCGNKPSPDPAFICVDSESLSGSETIVTFFLCEPCDAYTLVVNCFWPAEGGPRPVVAGGVIPRAMGDSDVEAIRSCSTPQDADCECDAHEHFVEMAEFMAHKEAERQASPDGARRRGNADGSPLTPEQLLADPEFIKGIAKGLAARSEVEDTEPTSPEEEIEELVRRLAAHRFGARPRRRSGTNAEYWSFVAEGRRIRFSVVSAARNTAAPPSEEEEWLLRIEEPEPIFFANEVAKMFAPDAMLIRQMHDRVRVQFKSSDFLAEKAPDLPPVDDSGEGPARAATKRGCTGMLLALAALAASAIVLAGFLQ